MGASTIPLRNGAPVAGALDGITRDLVVVDEPHNEIHEGDNYRYCDPTTLASGVSQDYLITTPNTAKWAHFTFHADGSDITSVFLYEGSDKTGTTAQTVFNSNRNSTNTAGVTVLKGTSGGTTDGTLLCSYSSGVKEKLGASTDHNSEWVLKQNTKYLLRITSGAVGNKCNINLSWYEHTNERE